MALNVRNNGVTEVLSSYSSTADLNGIDVDQSHRINVRTGGTTQYVGVSSDLSHPQSSTLRIQISGVLYAALKKSKLITDTTPSVQYYWGTTSYQARYGAGLSVDDETNRLAIIENNALTGGPCYLRVYNIDHTNQTIGTSIFTRQIGNDLFGYQHIRWAVAIDGDYVAFVKYDRLVVFHISTNTVTEITTFTNDVLDAHRRVAISQDILVIMDSDASIRTWRRTGTNTWTAQPVWHVRTEGWDSTGDFAISPNASYIAEKTRKLVGTTYTGTEYDTLRVYYRTGTDSWSAPVELAQRESPTSRQGIAMSNDYIVCLFDDDNSNFYSYQRTGTNTWSAASVNALGINWGIPMRLEISENSNYVLRGPRPRQDGSADGDAICRLFTRTGSNTWNSGFNLPRASVTNNLIPVQPIGVTSEGAAFHSIPNALNLSISYQVGVVFYWQFLLYT